MVLLEGATRVSKLPKAKKRVALYCDDTDFMVQTSNLIVHSSTNECSECTLP